MKMPTPFRSLAVLCAAALLLAGCGGGGGGGGDSSRPRLAPSAELASACTIEGQKQFARSYLDEVYLWYNEIREVDAALYATPEAYFDALLVRPKDEFSAAFYTGPLPRQQSPQGASLAANDLLGVSTVFVPVSTVLTSPGGRPTGYIQFDRHDAGAQDDLIDAFQQMQAANVLDLVLDLRRNPGGFLYIAQTAASMVTGPQSEGLVFEHLRYSDKRPDATAAGTLGFSSHVQIGEARHPAGTQLPQLNLPRVFVLTTGDTCSASESIINGLRGIDVPVIRIGTNTCGKPYGFHEETTCGSTYHYFAIEFQGYNAKGFGDYQGAGFTPTCQVAPAGNRGASNDALLNGALYYIDHDACPAGTATGVQSSAMPILSQQRSALWGKRLLLPEQQRR
jgi:hypothetical protein